MKKETLIITSGHEYIDIDAFACVYAYKELLQKKKCDVRAIITSNLNASITKKYREMSFCERNTDSLDHIEKKNYILVDISDPAHFEDFVEEDLVSQIIDHHSGFEQYWHNKIGSDAIIELIGAAATLIVREYKKEGFFDQISPQSAELLAVAIISNSLNFQAKITKEEDKEVYCELQKYFDYTEDFAKKYFVEVQQDIEREIDISLRDDGKSINEDLYISQLEVWDADHITNNFPSEIINYLNARDEKVALVNIIDLSKNRNVIILRDDRSLEWMKEKFPEFEYNEEKREALTDHVILRKELLPRI